MKKILSNFKFGKIKKSLIEVSNRFPIAIIIIVIISSLFFTMLHGNLNDSMDEIITRSIFSLIVTFFLSISITLNSQSYNLGFKKSCLWQLFPIGFGLLFFYTFNRDTSDITDIIYFLLSLLGILGFLFFAPYIKSLLSGNGKQSVYYAYFYKIATVFLISVILGGVLFVLGAIGLTATQALFDFTLLDDKLYIDWAIVAMSIFTPLFGLTHIPTKSEFQKDTLKQNTFFSFLIQYVAIPFIIVYFIILYTYSLKVLLTFGDWPKGEVSWLVIGFSILGYITYIFSYTFEIKNLFIAKFRRLFPFVVVPQIFMLFYAIYLRIAQYDITINRYFVVVFGLWLLLISIYFVISKKKYLGYIAALLTLFTIIISLGPWSVYSLPESRQLSRLKNNLVKANILQEDRKITPLTDYQDIDKELSGEIYEGIRYLCDFNSCNSIKQLFSEEYKTIEKADKKDFEDKKQANLERYEDNPNLSNKAELIEQTKYEGVHKSVIVSKITDNIKVERYNRYDSSKETEYNNFYIDYRQSHYPIEISGYSKMLRLSGEAYGNNSEYAIINTPAKQITIHKENLIIDTIDISDIINNFTLRNTNQQQVISAEMIFLIGDEYKILLDSIKILNPKYSGKSTSFYENSSGFILVK